MMEMESVYAADREIVSLHSKDTEDTDVQECTDEENDDDAHDERRFYESASPPPRFRMGGVHWRRYKLTHLVLRVRTCTQSRPCSICLYLFLTLQLFLGIVCVSVVSMFLLRPYLETSSYELGNCTAVKTQIDSEDRRCNCGKGCTSSYPCIRISVEIHHWNETVQESTTLFENELLINRKCTFFPPCKSSELANAETVEDYRQRFGTPSSTGSGVWYPCLFNPSSPEHAIRTRRIALSHVVHGLVWSSLVLVSAALLLACRLRKTGCCPIT